MVIGNNLYQVKKSIFDDDYLFNKIDEYSIDDNSDNQYSIYPIVSKDKNSNDNKLNKLYKNIL
jgi:hypothetical protein